MKRRIGSKDYNTETAIELFRNEGGKTADETNFLEIAYKKRSGEIFVYRNCGRRVVLMDIDGTKGYTPGEEILIGDEALAVFNVKQRRRFLGEVVTDPNEKKVRTFYLTNRAYEKLGDLAAEKGISKTELLELLIMKEQ